MRRAANRLLALALAACGCQNHFTSPSELHGVRVLAVRQDPASGSPGATVKLQMLVADDRPPTTGPDGKPVQPSHEIEWIAGCNNPPSRQYYACLPALRALGADPQNRTLPLLGSGEGFSVRLPDDVLSAAPELPTDPVHFGVSYVFFAACGGSIELGGSGGFPLGCTDPTGTPAKPSDFVIGFSTIYSYEGAENQNTNPVLDGVDFDGTSALAASPFEDGTGAIPAGVSCKENGDADCERVTLSHSAVCSDNEICAPLVSACAGKKCPTYAVLPHVAPVSFELFTGENEVMWASFYTSLGTFDDATRLVDDRVNGPTSDFSSGWKAPAPDGTGKRRTSTIWVTLNDQRGGATWASFDVVVE